MLNATRACEVLVGLPAVNILEVREPLVGPIEIPVESRISPPTCSGCGGRAWVKDRPVVDLADLTCFGPSPTTAVPRSVGPHESTNRPDTKTSSRRSGACGAVGDAAGRPGRPCGE